MVVFRLVGEFFRCETQDALDVEVDKVVDYTEAAPEAEFGIYVTQLPYSGEEVLDRLDLVKGLCEFLLWGSGFCQSCVLVGVGYCSR